MADENEYGSYIYVRLVSGEFLYTLKKNILGHCNYAYHRGSITKSILKKYDCINKNCRFFKKDENNPYWENTQLSVTLTPTEL